MFLRVVRGSKFLQKDNAAFRFCSSLTSQTTSRHTDSCVIRGFHQDIVLNGEAFETLDDFAQKHPLVVPIPAGRLIKNVNPMRGIEINECWRQVLWTGFIHSMICEEKGDSITDAYEYDNVGVLKDLNIMAFKAFVRAEGDEAPQKSKHDDYRKFIENIFSKLHSGTTTIQQLPSLENFLKSLSKPDAQLLHSSVFFSDEEMATLFIDIHRLLRHEFINRNLATIAAKILQELDNSFSNAQVVSDCHNSVLLPHLLGQHGPAKKPKKVPRYPPIAGSAIVDVHRIAVSHAIETDLLTKVRLASPHVNRNLLDSYPRQEVVTGLVHTFPLYLQTALDSFWKNKGWPHLDMERRHAVPTLYHFRSPPKQEVPATDENT